ncbi:MAG TPA: hypothetical protein VGH32_10250 [Pirellulales bacterium]|jgi:hypothetical protein
MAVSFELPTAIEAQLRQILGNLDSVAKEAAMIELYRRGVLTHYELSKSLCLDGFETDALLKKHNVSEDLVTPDEFAKEAAAIRKVLGE